MRLIDAEELWNDLMRLGFTYFARADVSRAIKEAPTIEPKQEWISVKDRLPEEGQEVLCFCAGDLANVYTWTGEEWVDSYGYYEDDDIISHWMPLPEPPETE